MTTVEDGKIPPLEGLILQSVHFPHDDDYRDDEPHTRAVVDVDDAHVITSMVARSESGDVRHKAVIDIDLPIKVVASSTPGHHHLYIDHEMSWEQYANLLAALRDAGIVEPGYVSASIDRGYTAVRLPWIKKGVST